MHFSILKSAVPAIAIVFLWGSVIADERRELEEKVNSLRVRAAEMAVNGHEGEAENLLRESKELQEKRRQLDVKDKESPGRREPGSDAQHLKEHLEELQSALKSAEAGEASERERDELREQIAKAERKLMQALKRGEHREVPEEFRARIKKLENANRRIRHMRVAAENLKAAEMHDLAHDLMQKAEVMEREIHVAQEELAVAISGGSDGRGQDFGGEIRQLRLENKQLRDELKALRQTVEELQKKPRESVLDGSAGPDSAEFKAGADSSTLAGPGKPQPE